MRRRVLALLVLVIVLVATMAFASLAVAQPPANHGNGIDIARTASEGRQGPPQGRPKIPESSRMRKRTLLPRLVAVPPPPPRGRELTLSPGPKAHRDARRSIRVSEK